MSKYIHGANRGTKGKDSRPASCRKNRPIHAFTAQNTGFSDRGSVQLMFTASEDKPHAVFLNLVQSRTESFAKRKEQKETWSPKLVQSLSLKSNVPSKNGDHADEA